MLEVELQTQNTWSFKKSAASPHCLHHDTYDLLRPQVGEADLLANHLMLVKLIEFSTALELMDELFSCASLDCQRIMSAFNIEAIAYKPNEHN